jgi:hypothetical protein
MLNTLGQNSLVQTLPTPKQLVSNPEQFAGTFLKILNKNDELVPFRWNNTQRDFHFKRTGHDLVLKARQMGFSTYVQGEMFRREVTRTTRSITLAHIDSSTQFLRDMSDRFWKNCRFGSIQPKRERNSAILTTYPDFDSSHTIGTAGSLDIGRGGSFSQFHGSEVAFWTDAEAIMKGAMQGGNPDVILESTPNGAQGYFYELCMEALSNRGIWKLHFYPWFTNPGYAIPLDVDEYFRLTDEESMLVQKHGLSPEQINWRRNKKSELKGMFLQEYPEDPINCFLTSGNGYFGSILQNVFIAPFGAVYDPTHIYTAGLDFGQSNDFSYMSVVDRTSNVQVDYLHINRLSWREQRRRIKGLYDKWHVKTVLAEANSIGSVNIEELRGDGVNVLPFWTDNNSKALLMGNYYDQLERGTKLLDWDVQKAEHYNFASTQLPSGVWKLAANGDGHDDTVIGNALSVAAPYAGAETVVIEQPDELESMDHAY